MVQDCPVCGLCNPPSAQRCDCGYDFASGRMAGSLLTDKDRATAPSRPVLVLAPFGCIAVLTLSTNIQGLTIFLVSAVFSSLAYYTFGMGVPLAFVLFMAGAIVTDLVSRRLQRLSLFDIRTGGKFLFMPLWLSATALGIVWGLAAVVESL